MHGSLEIEIQGQKRKTKTLDKVVYDPDNQKVKSPERILSRQLK